MPALQWFCRRWRTGSDDFFWSGPSIGTLSLVGGIMALSHIDSDGMVLRGCPLATTLFKNAMHGLGVVSVVCGLLLILVAGFSARGRIFDGHKRAMVPLLLYVITVGLLTQFILGCMSASRAVYHGEASQCITFSARSIIRSSIALMLFVPCAFLALMAISFDPTGRKKFDTEEDYHRLWIKRCNILCCCYANHSSGQEAFSDAARQMAAVFRGYDIVPSDIAAGMLLLQGYQTHRRYQRVRSIAFPPDPLGRPEVVSSQARYAAPLTVSQRRAIDAVHYYSKYYLGAYGWLLYTFMHLVTGVPRLLASDLCMCCRAHRHDGIAYHETCGCDTTALKKVTGLSDQDIVLTSFENSIYRPCFYVARDAASNTVVVAIRGTMSLEDCITDMVASPAEVMLDQTTNLRGWVHSGMLQSATNVLQMLIKDGVIQDLQEGRFKTSEIVVLGHSLGAGTACILSILMWTRFPELRSRFQCIAYCPPGGLLSDSARQFSDAFITATFVGFDVIPRMSTQNFDHLRESLLAVLTHTTASKAEVFCTCCCPKRLGERMVDFQPNNTESEHMKVLHRVLQNGVSFSDSPSSGSPSAANQAAQFSQVVPDERTGARGPSQPNNDATATAMSPTTRGILLHAPLTMIHYVKMVRQGKNACCCLSDAGGKWTRAVSNEVWCPVFISPEELNFVLCHPMMTLDHFPDRVFDVINGTQERLKAGDLDRFIRVGDMHQEKINVVVDVSPNQAGSTSSACSSSSASSSPAAPVDAFPLTYVPSGGGSIAPRSKYQSV